MSVTSLKQENKILRERIQQLKKANVGQGLRKQIENFLVESKKNIKQMNERVQTEQQKTSTRLHEETRNYEAVLKQQLTLLTENKTLSEQREQQETKVTEEAERITKQYESKIHEYEKKVQHNVKRLQELGSMNIISRLIKNDKFRAALAERGCNIEGLDKQQELEKVASDVEQRQVKIEEAEAKSALLDEELEKMRELLQTMRELMENMQKEKENILKQNAMLKQKLVESEGLIGKMMGGEVGEEEDREQGEAQDQEEEVNDEADDQEK